MASATAPAAVAYGPNYYGPTHPFGPNCAYHDGPIDTSASDQPPQARAHFFYNSASAIDDTLSPIPPHAERGGWARQPELPLRPFSARDNASLEGAWQECHQSEDDGEEKKEALVPVGVSRLNQVELPAMLMKPIYWHPINDISAVTRNTWFYTNSMLPVEQEVAEQLELGYTYMKPWTEAWQEELNAIVKSVDADAELKVFHKLWPAESTRPSTPQDFSGGTFAENLPEKNNNIIRLYPNSSVVYLNSKKAQILTAGLLPTRRKVQLGAIRHGSPIGIPVIRGFVPGYWQWLHGPMEKLSMAEVQALVHCGSNNNKKNKPEATTTPSASVCAACKLIKQPPKVTDLVLVIHGIGQKLSERVEAYHFTRAINAFRREVNVELADKATQSVCRENLDGSLAMLPINWRLMVEFDDKTVSTDPHENDFHLKDITPDSLPAVRGLISDVMLDIPYYLSHHKKKMTTAVINEANRVYRLWCHNHPGFEENGRVHLLAHSLGASMAIDILSQQPTKVAERFTSKASKIIDSNFFEFDTTTLFSCGSPAALFLLLNKANLLPRKGLDKPGMEGEDFGHGIAGEAGTYGCLAVNNMFNIVAMNDPIAYQQNACVDAEYARSLSPAYIPSATSSFLRKLSHGLVRAPSSSGTARAYTSTTAQQRPTVKSLPSTVEMETHNFSREEVAEKRMFLLNDNGQIDFFLSPGGIQYLDMLGAHSSYWISKEFVRFIVMEIGREPGKDGTLPVLRAVKKREWKKGSIA